jgi:hypothetical protein
VEKHLPEKGSRTSTADLRILSKEDLLDFLAVIAYERASANRTHKAVRWRIHTSRKEHGLEPEKIPTDVVAGHRIERFTIERIA